MLNSQGIYGIAQGVVIGRSCTWPSRRQRCCAVCSRAPIRHSNPHSPILIYDQTSPQRGAPDVAAHRRPGRVRVNLIVTVALASGMGAGAVSALNIAFATLILPQAAIAQDRDVLFPPLARSGGGEGAKFGAALTRAISVVIARVRAAIGLIVLGNRSSGCCSSATPSVRNPPRPSAFALMWYGVGLVGHSVLEVVTRGFYALHNTLQPVACSVASMAATRALAWLASAFSAQHLPPFGGLALANSIATALRPWPSTHCWRGVCRSWICRKR